MYTMPHTDQNLTADFLLRYNQQKVVKGLVIFPAGSNRQQQVLVVHLTHKQKMSPQAALGVYQHDPSQR